MQLDEALDDGEAEPRPAMAAGRRLRLEPLEGLLLEFRLDAAAVIGTQMTASPPSRLAPMRTSPPAEEKPMALDSRLAQDLAHALLVADELAHVLGDLDLDPSGRFFSIASTMAAGGLLEKLGDRYRSELELHGAGIDGGEVEDGVDDGQEILARRSGCGADTRAAWAARSPAMPIDRPSAKPMMLVSGVRNS